MQGKIAIEEHMAIPETVAASERQVGALPGWQDLKERLLDIHSRRIEEMDRHGIALKILSLNAPAVQAVLDASAAIELAKIANDRLAAEISRRPDRFRGFAALPMQDPDAAAEELTRCVRELGFVGGLVNGFTQRDAPDSAIYFDAPEYRPFWATVAELDAPFFLHPRSQIPERAQDYEGHPWLLASVWGFARETSIHALRLCGCGIFDEHPNLRIVLGHLGERIPYDLWRIDHRLSFFGDRYPCKRPLGAYFKDHFHVTTSGHFCDQALRCCIDMLGVDRVTFSVDYPFERMSDGASWFDSTEAISAEERIRIGRTNAVALFGLDLD